MKPTRVTLECEHDLYFKLYPPQPGEELWCIKCDALSTVGPRVTQVQWTYHPEGEWRSRRRQRMFTGVCENCEEEHKSHSWYQLRNTMERHYRETHISNPIPKIVLVDLLPPGSPPPF